MFHHSGGKGVVREGEEEAKGKERCTEITQRCSVTTDEKKPRNLEKSKEGQTGGLGGEKVSVK